MSLKKIVDENNKYKKGLIKCSKNQLIEAVMRWRGTAQHNKAAFYRAEKLVAPLIQDYQKLRERVSVEKIEKLLNKNELWVDVGFDIGYATPLVSKDLSQAIVTYLQQPTEH
jgi:ribosomal protein L18E